MVSEPAAEPMNTPCSQSKASLTSGMVLARRPPNRKAEIGTPAGFCQSGSMTGHCSAGAVKRELGWAALRPDVGRPVVALPVDEVRRSRHAHVFPPDVALVGEGDVGEDAVLA